MDSEENSQDAFDDADTAAFVRASLNKKPAQPSIESPPDVLKNGIKTSKKNRTLSMKSRRHIKS